MFVKTVVYEMMERSLTLNDADAWWWCFQNNRELQAEILDRIKSQLFDKGIDENDRVLGYYAMTTERINPIKKFNTHYTLKDTGEFYASMYIGWFTDYFFIDANGNKGKENIFDKFGIGIIGLNEDNQEWLHEEIYNNYMQYVESVLYKN